MPCDNFSNTVNQEYVDIVDAIELIINSEDWNGLIVCGDFNTSFSRNNAQSACLTLTCPGVGKKVPPLRIISIESFLLII